MSCILKKVNKEKDSEVHKQLPDGMNFHVDIETKELVKSTELKKRQPAGAKITKTVYCVKNQQYNAKMACVKVQIQ